MCDVQTVNDFKIGLCGIYAPNSDSPAFYDALDQNLNNIHWNKIVVGDYNLVIDPTMDRYNSLQNNKRSQKRLIQLMEENSLVDIWRIRNLHSKTYSWKNYAETQASRIDFAIISQAIQQLCENITYTTGYRTDHSAVFTSIKDNKHDRGYWLLENECITTS